MLTKDMSIYMRPIVENSDGDKMQYTIMRAYKST